MKLTYEQIKGITKGAARVVMDNGKVRFLRFTEEQEILYREIPDFYKKTFATAGVRLEFFTSSKSLSLKLDVSEASSRTYFNHDIYVNYEHRYSLGSDVKNGSDGHLTIEGSYALGDGKKKVRIYLPWSVSSEIISLEIDNGSSISPVSHSRSILMLGDSITHGYDAANPSLSYSSLLTDALDAEGINKGIGGEVFRSALASLPENYTPDIVTVAYGTNDWASQKKDSFQAECASFYDNLARLYPDSKIFALSPIWRGDCHRITKVGSFDSVLSTLKEISESIPNVTVIDCTDFVPHKATMFSPDVLHPNFIGFSHYAEGVINAIKTHLKINN